MKRLWALVLALVLLASCAPAAVDDGKTHILCTTYPVYLFTTAVVGDAEDVEVELLVNQQTSCLHDYTLTVQDMKAIDRADIIVINGAGLEDFMADALAQKDVPVIDSSCYIYYDIGIFHPDGSVHNPYNVYEDDPHHELDPHVWMDPAAADMMIWTIYESLWYLDLSHQEIYSENCRTARDQLWAADLVDSRFSDCPFGFITFHDGFQYFASVYSLELLKSIEEEEGSEASAKELEEIINLVKDNHIPAIFVEKNGSRRSADVIARETGCKVYELDLIMSGDGVGIEPYIQAMEQNLATIKEALG